jgi:hypothetical protein
MTYSELKDDPEYHGDDCFCPICEQVWLDVVDPEDVDASEFEQDETDDDELDPDDFD